MARRCELTGKGVLTGNNVSHANNKTRRRFLPNVRDTRVTSDLLNRTVTMKLSANGLRSVEHCGGLDNWLLKTPDAKLSADAVRLKRQVKRAKASASA